MVVLISDNVAIISYLCGVYGHVFVNVCVHCQFYDHVFVNLYVHCDTYDHVSSCHSDSVQQKNCGCMPHQSKVLSSNCNTLCYGNANQGH
jgi:hypothetical protein